MRLQQQLTIINRAIPVLGAIKWAQAPNVNTAAGDKLAVQSVLNELSALPYFRQLVRPMLTFHTFAVGGDDIVLDGTSYGQWSHHHSQLARGLVMMQEALQIAVPQADANMVSIRLPETTSLVEIARTAAKLEHILRPILEAEGETRISVQGFDTGSMWIVIALGQVGRSIVNAICQAAQQILGLALDAKRTLLSMERMGAEQAILEQVKAYAKGNQTKQTRKLAENIDKQKFQATQDHERVRRIERSIELLAKLNELGGEVRPTLEPLTPPPENEGFPDIAQMLDASRKELATAEQKLLPPTSDDDKKEKA